MSISNILSPNSYDLYCRSIQSTGDVYDVVTKTVRVFSNTNADIFGAISLKYVVRNGICTMWFPTTATVDLTANANYSTLYIAESAGGYVAFPCPDMSGEILFASINLVTQGDFVRHASMEIDCNSGGSPTQGRLIINLVPNVTAGGASPNFTYTISPGSNLFNVKTGLYGWSISYPVEGVI
jgi:hypothetical protein